MSNPLFDLTGRLPLVTGAAGGIGSAVAQALATAGASVLVTDIDENAASDAAERVSAAGGKAEGIALDIAKRAAADAAFARAAGLTDRVLNIFVNIAGVTAPAMFGDLTAETFRRLDIHVMGAFNGTQAALPFLPTVRTGRIINVTSSTGITGTLGQVNYSAAKAGIIWLHQVVGARTGTQEHSGECAHAPRGDTDDGDHPHQRKNARPHPAAPVGRTHQDRRRFRGSRLRRRVLCHGPGAAAAPPPPRPARMVM